MTDSPQEIGASAARRSNYRGALVVVDDEENMCRILTRLFQIEGYRVTAFTDPREALASIEREPPDVVLSDLRMPYVTGEELLRRVQHLDSDIAVIIVTAHGTIQGAVEALKNGAYDYLVKPFQLDEVIQSVNRAMETRRLRLENRVLSETIGRSGASSSDLLGDSEAMRDVRKLISRVAPSDSPVLVLGESGTGKELVARAVHRLSPRANDRFVPINCASIPENLLESELFGYERGAFTGATRTKIGLMELANRGTLFLDEIGELPIGLQAKLLRVLQEKEVQRVGGLRPIPISTRLIAATNRDLPRSIAQGEFRQDLYYRLNVIAINLPPLRDRPGDTELLANHFLARHAGRRKRRITLAPDAVLCLRAWSWPGNVRELENLLERTLVMLDGETIRAADLPREMQVLAGIPQGSEGSPAGSARTTTIAVTAPSAADLQSQAKAVLAFQEAQTPASPQQVGGAESAGAAEEFVPSVESFATYMARAYPDYRVARDLFEKHYLVEVLRRFGNSVSEAARRTNMSRRNFYEKMDKLGIPHSRSPEEARSEDVPGSEDPTP